MEKLGSKGLKQGIFDIGWFVFVERWWLLENSVDKSFEPVPELEYEARQNKTYFPNRSSLEVSRNRMPMFTMWFGFEEWLKCFHTCNFTSFFPALLCPKSLSDCCLRLTQRKRKSTITNLAPNSNCYWKSKFLLDIKNCAMFSSIFLTIFRWKRPNLRKWQNKNSTQIKQKIIYIWYDSLLLT